MSGAAERSTAQARQALEQAADELNRPGPSAPFAATPLTSLPATPGEGVDQARCALELRYQDVRVEALRSHATHVAVGHIGRGR